MRKTKKKRHLPADSTGEAVCVELLDPFEVLCAPGETTRERVRVIWCPDDEGFLRCHLLVFLCSISEEVEVLSDN